MWQALVQMFGASFLVAYGVDTDGDGKPDAPPTVWRSALSKLSWLEAKSGIAALARERRAYPPNLTEVMAACRPPRLVRYLGVPTSARRLALPRPRAREEHRGACLNRIREKLGR